MRNGWAAVIGTPAGLTVILGACLINLGFTRCLGRYSADLDGIVVQSR